MFACKGKTLLPVLLLASAVSWFGISAQAQAAAEKTVAGASLPQVASGWRILHAEKGKVEATADLLRIAPDAGTNLFHSPSLNYDVTNAPIVYAVPEGDFLLTAKVSAQLVEMFDVAALVLYEDDNRWAKLCFENSAHKEATIVTVITHGRSDDANSETIASPFVYLALARKGNEFSMHFSRDGKQWRLARHFSMDFAPGLRVGFAVHTRANQHFSAAFSEMALRAGAPKNMRQINPEDLMAR